MLKTIYSIAEKFKSKKPENPQVKNEEKPTIPYRTLDKLKNIGEDMFGKKITKLEYNRADCDVHGWRVMQVISLLTAVGFGSLVANCYFTSNNTNMWATVPTAVFSLLILVSGKKIHQNAKVIKEYLSQQKEKQDA